MVRVLLLIAVLAGLVASSGCGLVKKGLARKKKPASTDSIQDSYIGVVESVNPEQRFVLLRTDRRLAVAPGTKLETRAASGLRSSLTVTPERKANFLSADITEGMPAAGDVVVLPGQSNIPSLNAPAVIVPPASSLAPTSAQPSVLSPLGSPGMPAPVMPPPAQPALRLPQP
jgi:hypothetical protein